MQEPKLAKILRYGIYLSALMPLIIFSEYVSPFHFGKIVVFRSLVDILFVLYVALVMMDRSFLPRRNKIFWGLTIFTAVFGITTLTSISVYQSFFGTLERMGGWLSYFHFWLFFIIMTSVIRTRDEWFNLIKISVIVALLSTFYGFLQKTDLSFIIGSGGRSRIFGTIGNPALFAGYELLNIFLGLLLIFKPDSSKNEKIFYGAATLLNLIAIISTAVRGSILGIVVASIFFALLYPSSGAGYKKIRWTILTLIGIAIVFEGILILNHNSNFIKSSSYLSRISDVSPKTYTVNTRFWAWQAGIDGWDDSAKTIVFGWGPENFNIPFSIHFNPKFYNGPGSETLFDRAHNMFIEILVTMGLLGFLSYVLIFIILFNSLSKILKHSPSKEQRVYAAILISGLIAYIIHNAFIFDTSANLLLFFVTAGFIHRLVSPIVPVDKNSKQVKHVNYSLVYTTAYLLLIIAGVVIYKTNVEPSLANYATTRGIVASWSNDNTLAVQKFKEALSYDNTLGEYETRNRFAQYVLENYDKFTPKDAASQVAMLAIDEVKKNLSFKDDYLPDLYLSRAYIILGKSDPNSPYNDIALQYSQKALDISPTFVRTYYEVAQAYLNKKDYPKAIDAFNKAKALNPDVGITSWYLGALEVQMGNTDQGIELINEGITKGYAPTEDENLQLLPIYVKKNDLAKVVATYERLVEINPDKGQYHASLAAGYAQLGNIDGAVREARAAAKIDPSFEPEAKTFVESLGRQW